MTSNQLIAVKDAIHKLQLFLLEGIEEKTQLYAAGTLMSQSDYEDVVCERSIANCCGYPLCKNPLPSERHRKGRYRISLKEHKVYDLHETYMYCSSGCLIESRAFASSLEQERSQFLGQKKMHDILKLFDDSSLESKDDVWKNGDLGMSNLKIHEKMENKVGEVSLEEWIGPSNAIEGYVPQIDRSSKHSLSKNKKEGSKSKQTKPKTNDAWVLNESDFTSVIITKDEYTISKTPSGFVENESISTSKGSNGKMERNHTISEATSSHSQEKIIPVKKSSKFKKERLKDIAKDQLSIPKVSPNLCQNDSNVDGTIVKEESQSVEIMLKSSLKSSSVAKKETRFVSWADEKVDSLKNTNLCEIKEEDDIKQDSDQMLRFAAAEACAAALSKAAEAVASGESDIDDAVSEAGITILPYSHDLEGHFMEEDDVPDVETAPTKWPTKPGVSRPDVFDPDDSWYDAPPEGFSLTLSPFATMWMALFAWVTSSSMAYIYGKEESSHEEYLSVNGKEYPTKIISTDGLSSEIKQTLSGYLSRALPGLVSDLRLPVPTSTLEQGMGRLLETMTFVDSLPSLKIKQWQVIDLLFLDALSVCRIPALTPRLTSGRMLLHKVLEGAQISMEEYELMKDLMIPLGRAPQFSAQSGG